jgi:hypothetical protein
LVVLVILLVTIVPVALAWPFGDVPAGHWAYSQIRRVAYLNITSGCGGGNFCPNRNVTRAEMAVFLDNFSKAWTDKNENYIMMVDNRNNGSNRSGDGIIARSYEGNGLAGISYGGGSYAKNGVSGITSSSSANYAGVYGTSTSGAAGLHGESVSGRGVYGWSNGTTNAGAGILGQNINAAGTGVWGRAPSYGIVGDSTSGSNYAGYFYDNIYVGGNCVGCAMAYSALNDDAGPLKKGDLVAISGMAGPLAGQAIPVLKVQRASDQALVAGVVLARGTEQPDPDGEGVALRAEEGNVDPGGYLLILVQGMAQVRADAAAGIQAGQRLAVSGEGLAVAGEAEAQTIGRAVGPVDGSTGLVWVLVDLQ